MSNLQDVRNGIKVEWEIPQDSGRGGAIAIDLANERTKEMHEKGVHGFAKAICRMTNEANLFQWQVRKITIELPQSQQTFFSNFIPRFKSESSEEEMEILQFFSVIQDLIACIQQNKNQLADPGEITKKLNKLLISLLQVDSWPLKDKENTIQKVIEKFQEYKLRCQSKDFLIQNQENFKFFVSKLNKVLHKKTMTLPEISDKIVTKLEREIPQGEKLYGRVRELIQLGTERIYWPDKKQDEEVVHFSKAFALHAYVYKKDADNQRAKEMLANQLERFIELIIAYDHRNNSSTLTHFLCQLMECLELHGKGEFDKISLASFGALVWTFEILVNDKRFIEYMQSPERQSSLNQETLRFLFQQESTWESVANLIVSLGNFELFKTVIEARLALQDRRCMLNENQIALLFQKLNVKLQEKKNDAHREMYRHFLDLLSKMNRLHYLKTYAEEERHIQILRQNLALLGFSFMTSSMATLPSFFGNATFRSIKDNRKEIPVGANVRLALLRLFSKSGKNPVKQEEDFNRALQKLSSDFRAEGFEILCEEILGSIGEGTNPLFAEVAGQRIWKPVEQWLSEEVDVLYQTLKKYVLLCLPMKWQMARLDDEENYLDRLCLLEDKLYTVEQNERNELVLKDVITQEVRSAPKQPLLLSELLSKVKLHLKDQMSPPPGPQLQQLERLSRRGISRLTEKYMLFHNDKQDKRTLQKLLDLIIGKMVADQNSVLFTDRLEMMAEFLNAMSPVLANLESLVKVRFYNSDQTLKLGVAQELIKKAQGEGKELEVLLDDEEKEYESEVAYTNELISTIARLLSVLCAGDIEKIINRCSLAELRKAAPQLESVIGRKVDELSYETKDFIDSFLSHDVNKSQVPLNVLRDAIGDLAIKDKVIQDYGDFLMERPIPVYFLLPNQALAIQLSLSNKPELESKNLLMKMGTGQGKSILIALTALNEAKKIKDKPNSRVFVFTSYDHLARRDHELGKDFFKKENIPSVCISKIDDVANFTPDTKIVYGDVETIEDIIRKIMLKWVQGHASSSEKEFMQTIYESKGGEIRIVLDEYDLLLHDLSTQDSKVADIPTSFLEESFVTNNRAYCDFLPGVIKPGTGKFSQAMDPSTGKTFHYVPWYYTGTFNLPVSVMRLSTLIQRAKRVIGFSGTASYHESDQLPNRLFFEIPASQNPAIFETQILAKGEPKPAGDKSYISCHTYLEITEGIKEVDGILEIPANKIQEYCDATVNDVKAIRKVNENAPYQRPIVIFCDKLLQFKKPNSRPQDKPELIWDKLVAALRAADIPLSFLPDEVSDIELQEVAREGRVTLTTIDNGRGADIRVNSKIEEGLHVLIGVPVIHQRLLYQLIGRTGRMGRKGSYSVVTLGSVIKSQSNQRQPTIQFYNALHELTKLFVKKLSDSPVHNKDECKRWILFLAKAFSTRYNTVPKINLNHARSLCGDCSTNPILKPYF